MSFEDWKPEHGPKTVHEVIRLVSSDPDPDELMMDEVFDERGAFPVHQRQIERLLSALRYAHRLMSATSEGGGELSEPAWMIEDGDYADYYLDAARKLHCRTLRSLPDLIDAGKQVTKRLAAARAGWEVARQKLLDLLKEGKIKPIGRPSDLLGNPRSGAAMREIPQALWYGAVTVTDEGRIVADGTGDQWQQPADPEWAYAELQLIVSETPQGKSQYEISNKTI